MDPDHPEPMRRISSGARGKGRPLSTEASIIPGETEEDGMLRREYVLVGDTRAIEFNKTVDGKITMDFEKRKGELMFVIRNHSRAEKAYARP